MPKLKTTINNLQLISNKVSGTPSVSWTDAQYPSAKTLYDTYAEVNNEITGINTNIENNLEHSSNKIAGTELSSEWTDAQYPSAKTLYHIASTINNNISKANADIAADISDLNNAVESRAKEAVYPVGSYFLTPSNDQNPANILGFGSWARCSTSEYRSFDDFTCSFNNWYEATALNDSATTSIHIAGSGSFLTFTVSQTGVKFVDGQQPQFKFNWANLCAEYLGIAKQGPLILSSDVIPVVMRTASTGNTSRFICNTAYFSVTTEGSDRLVFNFVNSPVGSSDCDLFFSVLLKLPVTTSSNNVRSSCLWKRTA